MAVGCGCDVSDRSETVGMVESEALTVKVLEFNSKFKVSKRLWGQFVKNVILKRVKRGGRMRRVCRVFYQV